MKRTSLIRTLILTGVVACASLTSVVSAGTEIVKCVDADGKVTLTDAACPGNASTQVIAAGSNEPDAGPAPGEPAAFEAVAAERYSMPRIARRPLPEVKPLRPGAAMTRDIATLKAARESLHMLDGAAQALRAQRLAQQ